MTNEEAIRYFKRHIDLYCVDGISREAEEMAIQALSQEPCTDAVRVCEIYADVNDCENGAQELCGQCIHYKEPCDDAISRKDAEQMFRNIRSHLKPQDYKSAEEFNTRDLMLLNAEQMIHALPSVTQKSGKWIKIQSGDKDFPESIVCSKCGSENSHLDFNENAEPIGKVFVTSKYCPNCGAKMESEEK